LDILEDEEQLNTLRKNILELAQKDSARRIAEEVIKLAKEKQK
jgi:UDP-N-acetylglucosamine:LPS N-acetylglucosamine transferase